jgi:hypothetical protein
MRWRHDSDAQFVPQALLCPRACTHTHAGELIKTKKKVVRLDPKLALDAKWKHCQVSNEPLKEPIVSCALGRLYNKVRSGGVFCSGLLAVVLVWCMCVVMYRARMF